MILWSLPRRDFMLSRGIRRIFSSSKAGDKFALRREPLRLGRNPFYTTARACYKMPAWLARTRPRAKSRPRDRKTSCAGEVFC